MPCKSGVDHAFERFTHCIKEGYWSIVIDFKRTFARFRDWDYMRCSPLFWKDAVDPDVVEYFELNVE